MAKTNFTLRRAEKLLKLDESKLTPYIQYYRNEVLYEPDENQPNMPTLTETQRMMLNRYRKTWASLCMGRTQEMVRQMLMKEESIDERYARIVVNETYWLYGNLDDVDITGKRMASIQFYRTLANLALKEKNYDMAAKCWKDADQLEGLFNQEQQSGLDPADFMAAGVFVFSSNLNTLRKNQKQLEPDE